MITLASSISTGSPDFSVARRARAAATEAQLATTKAPKAGRAGGTRGSDLRQDAKATSRRGGARAKAAEASSLRSTLLTAPAAVNQAAAAVRTPGANVVPAAPTVWPVVAAAVVNSNLVPAPLAPVPLFSEAAATPSAKGADLITAAGMVPPTLAPPIMRDTASPDLSSALSPGSPASVPSESQRRTELEGSSSQSKGNAVWARSATAEGPVRTPVGLSVPSEPTSSQRGNAPNFGQRESGPDFLRSFTPAPHFPFQKWPGLAYGHARRNTVPSPAVSMTELLFRPAASPFRSATFPGQATQRFGEMAPSTPLTLGGIALEVLSSWSALRSTLDSQRASRALPGVSEYARSQTRGSQFSRGASQDRFF